METTKTLLFVLCDHLRLPANPLLLLRPEAEDWPESNAVSDVVLQVTEAPTQLVDGCLVTTPTLPRWEPQGRLGRLIAGLEREPSREKFLLVEETRKHLRGLEGSFRDVLWERLESWRDSVGSASDRGRLCRGGENEGFAIRPTS
jgi:hypothetical protein